MQIIKDYPCRADNYSKRVGAIKYLVVHYVGATGSAKDNAIYYSREYVGNSAHFFVGHASENGAVYESVPPAARAWHCGSETGIYKHPDCRNDNSIGIELCCKYDETNGWYFEEATLAAAAELIKSLMAEYGIKKENILRHYDVTGKGCPAPLLDAAAWDAFLGRLAEKELTEPNDIVWELAIRGIVSDAAGMVAEMEKDRDARLYWLARKTVRYIRERELSL